MIQAIIFDCFGVLTADQWREFRSSLPIKIQNEASELNQAYAAGLITKEEFLAQIHKLTGYEEAYIADVLTGARAKNKQLLGYIAELKEGGYKVGLLSNIATPWITDYFLTAQEQALFDAMVFSFEAGMTKPDPRIYQLACERLQVEPPQAVMIDDIDRYCEAARDTGMQAITYQDFTQLRQDLEQLLDTDDDNRA